MTDHGIRAFVDAVAQDPALREKVSHALSAQDLEAAAAGSP